MDILLFLKAFVIGFFISLPVTPIGILCLKRMFARGPLIGFLSGAGSATADFIYSIFAALGVSYITSQLEAHPILIQLISGIVLIAVGVYILATPPTNIKSDLKKNGGYWQAYLSATILTLSNPATIITFAGIFTAMGLSQTEPTSITALVVATGVFLGAMAWWGLSSILLSLVHKQISSSMLEKINNVCGVIVCIFGVLALVSMLFGLWY